jgi:hypothetical protein
MKNYEQIKEEIIEVKSRLIQENRDGKLGSILEDKPFTEKKLEDDEEYKELMGKLLLDYII